jgi:hypothetical protein
MVPEAGPGLAIISKPMRTSDLAGSGNGLAGVQPGASACVGGGGFYKATLDLQAWNTGE